MGGKHFNNPGALGFFTLKAHLTVLIALFCVGQLIAQKEFYKQWGGKGIDTLIIDSDALSTVRVFNTPHSDITMMARVQGELAGEVMIYEQTGSRSLKLGTGLAPYFIPDNDKLAAHKVLSVEMTIEVPRGKSLVILSKFGSVQAMGSYEFFEVALENGHCTLSSFYGDARLYSINGNIDAGVLPGVSGKADSRYGKTSNRLSGSYERLVEARSIYGNILLRTSQ